MALELLIKSYYESDAAEAGTNTTTLVMTGHGLATGDMIVNTTCRTTGTERGSRTVTKSDDNTLTMTAIDAQTSGDTIWKFKFTDRTSLLHAKSLRINRVVQNQSSCSFILKSSTSFIPRAGEEIVIKNDGSKIFAGILKYIARYSPSENTTPGVIMFECRAEGGYNAIPSRRTIQVDYGEDTTCGTIVAAMINDYLSQEGITAGTISTGATFADGFNYDTISISDVLDECALRSGFQWFIDENKALQFYQDPGSISNAAHNLVDGNGFIDYCKVKIIESLEDYVNKVFVQGGIDEEGSLVTVYGSDDNDQNSRQQIEGGTGVYGKVIRDSAIKESDYKTAGTGTTTTNINISSHGQSVGDMVYNYTRGATRIVTNVVSASNFTVDEISGMTASTAVSAEAGTTDTNITITGHSFSEKDTFYNSTIGVMGVVNAVVDVDNVTVSDLAGNALGGQTDGDTILIEGDIIVFYDDVNDLIQNELKKNSNEPPMKIEFESSEVDWVPGTKMQVKLSDLGITSTQYYLIESVEIFDISGKTIRSRVNATLRDNSSFSTQRSYNAYDLFGGGLS